MEAGRRPRKLQKREHDASMDEVSFATGTPESNGHSKDAEQPTLDFQAQAQSDSGPQDGGVMLPQTSVAQADICPNGYEEPITVSTSPNTQSIHEDHAAPPLSKNQQKKLKRKQEWEASRDARKAWKKGKLKEKRERKRATRAEEATQTPADAPPPKKPPPKRAIQLPITIVMDCDFDNLMSDNERISLGSQLTRAYSDNKNAHLRAHLTIASFGGKLRERFNTVLSKHHELWKGVRFLDEDFVGAAERAKIWMCGEEGGKLAGALLENVGASEEAQQKARDKGEVVYLSSDSDYTLSELKPYSTYIIGGFVDKNRHKGICYKRAMDRGIKTARLPIGDYLEMASRKVLTTNHVNEIMLRWLELGDWGKAFMQVIPKRKGGQLKSQVDSMDEDEEEVEEENGLSGTPRLSEAATGPQVEDHEKSELGDTRVSRNPTDEEWQDLLGEYVHAQKNIKDDKELNARQPILNGKEQVSEHDATDHDRIQKAVDV
ncbi:hypothetical protein LTR04_001734 [Oleoguttula sp. CCFEE 6159]|nr:hypothetical protein LTR04_001734 [Oleoguttula sp. CCFEE 6159]